MSSSADVDGNSVGGAVDAPTSCESLTRTIRRLLREELHPLSELIRTVLGPGIDSEGRENL